MFKEMTERTRRRLLKLLFYYRLDHLSIEWFSKTWAITMSEYINKFNGYWHHFFKPPLTFNQICCIVKVLQTGIKNYSSDKKTKRPDVEFFELLKYQKIEIY